MRGVRLANSVEEVTRIVGAAPPVLSEWLHGHTRVTGRWINEPYDTYVHAMEDHVLAATFAGDRSAEAHIDGKRIVGKTKRGGVTLLARGHEGHFQLSGRVIVSNVYLGPDRLQACADQIAEGRVFELYDRVNFTDPQLFSIMEIICAEAESPGQHARMYLEQALDLLCLHLLRSHSSLSSAASHRQYGLASWQVKRVTDYMRDHLSADIGLQELAGVVGMSRFHFCSMFRRSTGTAPYAYLTRLRMDVACQLLTGTQLDIAAVGLAVGYTSFSAFSTAFARNVGVTPRQFRQSAGAKKPPESGGREAPHVSGQ